MKIVYRSEVKPDPEQLAIDACQGTALQKIILKARFLHMLDRYLQTLLPPECANACQVMNIVNGTVILGVKSATVATRLRYFIDSLIQTLKGKPEYRQLVGIQIKITL